MQTLTNLEQWFLINYITLIVYKSGLGNCIYPDCLQAYILTSPYLKECKSEAGAIYFITPDQKKRITELATKKMGCRNHDLSCKGRHMSGLLSLYMNSST